MAELLHNAIRHAQARHVWVEVLRQPASLRLTVWDDGRGFDAEGPPPARGWARAAYRPAPATCAARWWSIAGPARVRLFVSSCRYLKGEGVISAK
ncbi:ATP-binding protein [Hymenobacter caeli]|uniref:Histidine kinase/HSP90-like ATPase domain-containing protein n=1 Tax=Hymenobacter caeli TaxID=2735894 RepID=A0ABX2FLZ7_9BACT|nr:ATP-binding protein [Hymenobacter caeli]NRT18160.1 hypothetical protein [Hymenobacter caeli]